MTGDKSEAVEAPNVAHPWHDLPSGDDFPKIFNAVIEVPTGSKVKYRLCERTGVLRVEKVVGASLIFPFNYGFVPQTIAADEDALDVLVLMSEPVHPGSFLRAKPIGLMTMVMAAATPRAGGGGHTPRAGGGGNGGGDNVEFGGFNTPKGDDGAGGDASAAATTTAAAAEGATAAAAAAAAAAAGNVVPVSRGDGSTATTPRVDTGFDGRGLVSLTSADVGQDGVSDDKVIAVHADDPNFNCFNSISDLPPHRLQEIKRFVLDYSSAEKKGLKVSVDAFEGPEAAMKALEKARAAYGEAYLPKRPRTG